MKAKPSVYEQALTNLNKNIKNKRWQAGQRLPTIKQLANEMGISITIVREALHTLADQGVISIEHGRGIYLRNDPNSVYASDNKEISKIPLLSMLKARLLIEPEQAFLCAQNSDESLQQQIQNVADQLDQEMQVGDSFLTTDLKFHQLIAEGAAQPALLIMSLSLSKYQISTRRMTNTLPQMRTKAALYHQLIASAILTRDGEEARKLMEMHINSMIDPLEKIDESY